MDTRKIVEAAELGIVELVWLSAAMEAYLPREGRPLISVETVFYVAWPAMEAALDKWEAADMDPNHLDTIHKVRAAAESLGNEDCPRCHGLGTVPNTNDASLNVRMKCPNCEEGE